jgi:hypothetical protein
MLTILIAIKADVLGAEVMVSTKIAACLLDEMGISKRARRGFECGFQRYAGA